MNAELKRLGDVQERMVKEIADDRVTRKEELNKQTTTLLEKLADIRESLAIIRGSARVWGVIAAALVSAIIGVAFKVLGK